MLVVVSLPYIALVHYGPGVKSSILFARTKDPKKLVNYPICMAIVEYIGSNATGRETLHKVELKQYRQLEQTHSITVSSDRENKIFLIHRAEMEKRP